MAVYGQRKNVAETATTKPSSVPLQKHSLGLYAPVELLSAETYRLAGRYLV